jgi:hypothetical protein
MEFERFVINHGMVSDGFRGVIVESKSELFGITFYGCLNLD